MNIINPSEMTPETRDQFLEAAAAELERLLPEIVIAIDKVRAAQKINSELLRRIVEERQ